MVAAADLEIDVRSPDGEFRRSQGTDTCVAAVEGVDKVLATKAGDGLLIRQGPLRGLVAKSRAGFCPVAIRAGLEIGEDFGLGHFFWLRRGGFFSAIDQGSHPGRALLRNPSHHSDFSDVA